MMTGPVTLRASHPMRFCPAGVLFASVRTAALVHRRGRFDD